MDTENTMYVGQILKLNNVEVQVLAVDSDPRAAVWVFEVANPDVDHMVAREELR